MVGVVALLGLAQALDAHVLFPVQVIGMEGEKKELGPMPATSIGLLSVIGGAWLVIGVLYVRGRVKDKKQNKK